ncbi:hypothetical protein ACFRJ9_06970 [Paenarthrobacter sp. NPDC056912]|uniref:hypothetical protein n=1 Tax=Paenarthrobacter sp. NPDC056912 TaxID=3345965 RepID=UPI0036733358
MTESLEPGVLQPGALAEELLGVVLAVDGVTSVFPAQPMWQSIAGAALSAVTGDPIPLVGVDDGDTLAVKVRIGVGTSRPAPAACREVADAVRSYLLPRAAAVDVSVVKIGT